MESVSSALGFVIVTAPSSSWEAAVGGGDGGSEWAVGATSSTTSSTDDGTPLSSVVIARGAVRVFFREGDAARGCFRWGGDAAAARRYGVARCLAGEGAAFRRRSFVPVAFSALVSSPSCATAAAVRRRFPGPRTAAPSSLSPVAPLSASAPPSPSSSITAAVVCRRPGDDRRRVGVDPVRFRAAVAGLGRFGCAPATNGFRVAPHVPQTPQSCVRPLEVTCDSPLTSSRRARQRRQ